MKIIIYIRSADAPEQVDERLTILRNTSADRGWSVAGVHVDRVIGATKGRSRLPGHAATLNAIARQEVDGVLLWSLHHLSTTLDSLLDTLAELHQHGVKLIVHDHSNDAMTVENGGLLSTADLLVDARRAYRREAIIAGQLKARACGTRFGRPPLAPARIEKVRLALRSGQGVRQAARSSGISPAKASRIRAEMVGAGLMG
jgi:DNA invertase Pin-like site-specific DNA recombinase